MVSAFPRPAHIDAQAEQPAATQLGIHAWMADVLHVQLQRQPVRTLPASIDPAAGPRIATIPVSIEMLRYRQHCSAIEA
jgi:hypothetical protein